MASHHDVPELITHDEQVATTPGERAAEVLLRPFQRFARLQVAGGVLLIACTVVALALANSPLYDLYHHLLEQPLGIFFAERRLSFSLHHWINDGLMAVFFFAVGLEIKREFLVGELAEPRKAMLPIAAAIGGMIVPASIYATLNAGGPGAPGWGIPMATDIAFALGALVMLGNRVPEALKVFLVALAIVDDLGAVLVIAMFYTSDLALGGLAIAGVFTLALVAANVAGARRALVYAPLGVGVWYGMLTSGVHATLAGVIVAMTIPASVKLVPGAISGVLRRGADKLDQLPADRRTDPMGAERVAVLERLDHALEQAKPPLQRFEHAVAPWVTFAIMPVFALFNAGVHIDASALASLATPVPLGIVLGLVVGKQVGVFGASWLAVKAGIASLPQGVSWRQVYGTAWLAGIGFTMSLFISSLAFGGTAFEDQAKMGILLGSLVSALGGVWLLVRGARAASERRTL